MLPTVPHERHKRPKTPAALDVAAVDGFILYSLARDDPLIARAIDRGRPVVGVDMHERDGLATVCVDDRGGAQAAACHMIGKGHRRFGVIALATSRRRTDRAGSASELAEAAVLPTAERWQGYVQAFAEVGITPSSVPIRIAAINDRACGRRAAEEMLQESSNRRPTVILAMSDVLALGARDACVKRGLGVPEDVEIVGFDGVQEEARSVGLPTVRQEPEEKGKTAVCALLDEDTDKGPLAVTFLS